ncbi:MAG TPA: non-homologous end-joining DNA ligase [Kofleriaceae bacterium]|nr:non-homologous end-joining DNA ligase [Kofleriaceae bacterium]
MGGKVGELTFGDVTVALTNTDRVVFPDAGITKGEVIAYYKDVADLMVPELRDRALTMERFTKGIDQGGFFQKHAQKHYPAWIPRALLGGKTSVEYPICNSQAALVYFANQGGLAFHIWTSHATTPMQPNEIVFDLDPPDASAFELVRHVARVLRDLCDELGLPPFVKTTGSKGLHVVAPVDGKAGFDQVHQLVDGIAKLLVARYPDLVTLEFYKKDRKGRLYFDTGRNMAGATFVAPYSLRGRPGAPISAPLTWNELEDPALRPDGIRLRDFAERRAATGDPWFGWRKHPGSVAKALAKLAKL